MNGNDTRASICAVNEQIDVQIESENMGIRSRSNGRTGYCLWSWLRTKSEPAMIVMAASVIIVTALRPCEAPSMVNINSPKIRALNIPSRQSNLRITVVGGFFGR